MYEFFSQNQLYIVMTIVLLCWFGIFGYLMKLDKRVSEIEQSIK
ncbi:MAG: CcmD family protein [Ignavibacteria bacterium]|nr:CcmD family protein [Ignavibacteria bacterium]